MSNYAKPLPLDKGGLPIQESPAPVLAQARYASENATASSAISFTHNTTQIEVAAVGGAAVVRWIPTTDTAASVISAAGATSNFDHVIPSGGLRRFVLPIERLGTYAQSVQGINRAEGLYQRIALKSVGVSSVLLTEY